MDDLNRSTHIYLLYLQYKLQFERVCFDVIPFGEYRARYLEQFGE